MRDTRTNDDVRELRRRLGNAETAIERVPVRLAGGSGSQRPLIRAQVNQSGGATTSDATVPFDNAVAIIGSAPAGGTGNFENVAPLSQNYANDAGVMLWQGDDGKWYPERGPLAIIRATVNQGGGYTGANTTVPFDGATAIIGRAPVGGTGVFQNHLADSGADNDLVMLWQGTDNLWYADKRGGEGGGGEAYTFGCGLAESENHVEVDPLDLAGIGLETGEGGGCALAVKGACGIVVSEDGVAVDGDQLAGDGLEASDCLLSVKPGYAMDVDPTDGVEWDPTEITNYDEEKNQILVNFEGVVRWASIAEALNKLDGYTGGDPQSIGHPAGGATQWEDDVACV